MNANIRTPAMNPIAFQHYRELPAVMFAETKLMPSPSPSLIEVNRNLFDQLEIDSAWFRSEQGLAVLAGNFVNDDNQPIAMAYSGHQFGQWSPVLGDGRAHMLGQMKTGNGSLVDVQLKGSGRTRYSRNGDGRATLGAVLREYLVSEAMTGLGIPTTRSLAILSTGAPVMRERSYPGAILVRSTASHLRVGSFQYAYSSLGEAGVRALADFTIAKHFPDLKQVPSSYLELLGAVAERQASLIARWMLVGFIHGVMNTDNMSIIGETIDYGPCAFMDEFNPKKVFSSIDSFGRYAWDQQSLIANWNLMRFAETLLPLLDSNKEKAAAIVEERLANFAPMFDEAFQSGLWNKLGLAKNTAKTRQFAVDTLGTMAKDGIDFTIFFNRLTRVAVGEPDEIVLNLFTSPRTGLAWMDRWRSLRSKSPDALTIMRRANPVVIARNHRVEQAIEAAVDYDDFAPFRRLCQVLGNPFEIDSANRDLEDPPLPEQRVAQTFCGT